MQEAEEKEKAMLEVQAIVQKEYGRRDNGLDLFLLILIYSFTVDEFTS